MANTARARVNAVPCAVLARDKGHTALSFFAGKRAPTDHQNLLERGLPAIRATRFVRHTALSFFAGKPGSNRQP